MIASILLVVILIQVFLPVYSAYAYILPVIDAAAATQRTVLISLESTHIGISGEIAAATGATAAATAASAKLKGVETFWQRVLNVAAYAAINIVIQTITRQIIGWIQGRDSGFVQNLQAETLRTADAETGKLLNEISPINLCGNIGAFLKLSIGAPNASFRQRMQCSVTGIVGNFQNFYDNFANGGWPAFFQISLEPQNNAYGAFLLAANVQAERQNGRQTNLLENLKYGNGFEGFKVGREANCQDVSEVDAKSLQESTLVQNNDPGAPKRDKPEESIKIERADDGSFMSAKFCDIKYDTKTPGKLFADALPKAVFAGLDRTVLATQIDQGIAQIITALLQRIIQESVSGGKGLFGSRDLGTAPQTTLTEAGFNTAYITNQTDDISLRLEASQTLLDAKIQDIDTKIAAIAAQIAPLEAACAAPNPGDTCRQAQIDTLNTEKTRLITDRAAALSLLTRAYNGLNQILDLRVRLLTTTSPALLENLNTKLIGIESGAEQVIQQAGGPPEGQNGVDPDDNFVRITDNARDRATAIVAYLEKRITAEIDPIKKAALMKARDDLKKLADDLGILRTAFLDAISKDIATASVMTQITGKISDINDKILSVYSL